MAGFSEKLSVLTIIFLCIAANWLCHCQDVTKHKIPKCGSSENETVAADLTASEGKLDINQTDLSRKTICVWNITYDKTVKDRVPLYLHIRKLSLESGDQLNITNRSGEILYSVSQKHSVSSILLTGVDSSENLTIILSLSNDAKTRSFDVVYSYKKDHTINVSEEDGTLSVLANSYKRPTNLLQDLKLHFELLDSLKSDLALVLGFDSIQTEHKKISFSTDGTKYTTYVLTSPDIIGEESSSQVCINIEGMSVFENKGDGIKIYYSLFNKNCTYLTDITGPIAITFPRFNPYIVSSFRCLRIISEPDSNYILDYNNVNFLNNLDSITIRTGNRRNASVLAVLNHDNKNEISRSYINSIAMSKNLYIVYDCPSTHAVSTAPPANQLGVSPLKTGGVYNDRGTINVPKTDVAVYVIRGPQPSIKDVTKFTAGIVEIYDTADISGAKPALVVKAPQHFPDKIVLTASALTVKVHNITAPFSFAYISNDNITSVLVHPNSGSFSISKASDPKVFIIPSVTDREPGTYIIDLQISTLVLPQQDCCIKIKKLADGSDAFKMCGKAGLQSPLTESVPRLVFDGSSNLEFSYIGNASTNNNVVLLQASFVAKPLKQMEHNVSLKLGENLTITPDSYPGVYPLFEQNVCGNNTCSWVLNAAKMSYVKFEDIDLAPSQTLNLKYKPGPVAINSSAPLPDDHILDTPGLVQLFSPMQASYTLGDKVSGRGFKLNVEAIACGGLVETKSTLETDGYPSPTNNTKCLWIIHQKNEKHSGQISLNITVKYGDKGNEGILQIYDSASLRDPRLVNMSKPHGIYQSSTDKVIVEYSASKSGLLKAMEMSWVVNECDKVCNKSHRCILPDWVCNGIPECGVDDWSDEVNCNNTNTCPKPKPQPQPPSGGVSGWVIVFVIIPLAMFVGAMVSKFGPDVLRRMQSRPYQEFSSYE